MKWVSLSHTEIYSKYIAHLSVKGKTIKLLEVKNIEQNFQDLGLAR